MNITYTQCKQLTINHCLRDIVANMTDQPLWITEGHDLEIADIQAIQQGGCASGAFMPAVTYFQAAKIMNDYGDDIFEYIECQLGEIPQAETESWSRMAVFYYSYAVELWCASFDLDGVNWD